MLKVHTAPVMSVAFSPDGKLLASGDRGGKVRLWDTTTGKEKAVLHGHTGAVMSVAFSPDGKLLASSGEDRTVRLWDVPPARKGRK